MNFLVILIASVLILGLGIALLTKVIGQAEEYKDTIDAQTEARIERLMDDGGIVVIPDILKKISNGKSDSFAIGINNEAGEDGNFRIVIKEDELIIPNDPNSYTFNPSWNINTGTDPNVQFIETLTLANNEHAYKRILVKVPGNADKGRYSLNVYVCFDSTATPPIDCHNNPDYKYGTLQKIYIDNT